MALLYEIAEYSLKELSFIPEEKACVPVWHKDGECQYQNQNSSNGSWIQKSTKIVNKKVIQTDKVHCTTDPCISNDDNSDKLSKLKEHFAAKSSLVGIVVASLFKPHNRTLC